MEREHVTWHLLDSFCPILYLYFMCLFVTSLRFLQSRNVLKDNLNLEWNMPPLWFFYYDNTLLHQHSTVYINLKEKYLFQLPFFAYYRMEGTSFRCLLSPSVMETDGESAKNVS